MSIRTRIAVSIFFSALVLVLIFAGLRYQEVIHNSEERSEEQAVAKAKSLQTELRFLLLGLKNKVSLLTDVSCWHWLTAQWLRRVNIRKWLKCLPACCQMV